MILENKLVIHILLYINYVLVSGNHVRRKVISEMFNIMPNPFSDVFVPDLKEI